jgi:hypothetical protein
MDTSLLASLATAERQCFSLVVDPLAEASERWLCVIGLDVSEVGPTPTDAVDSAMARLVLGPECHRADVDDEPIARSYPGATHRY